MFIIAKILNFLFKRTQTFSIILTNRYYTVLSKSEPTQSTLKKHNMKTKFNLNENTVKQVFILFENGELTLKNFKKAMTDLLYDVSLPNNKPLQQQFFADVIACKNTLINQPPKIRTELIKFFESPLWENN
jgi:ferritin-like protein